MPEQSKRFTWIHGAVVRGPRDAKRIALIFTGGDYGEGSENVLDTLRERGLPGAFFFTGDYLRDSSNQAAIRAAIEDGHYLGPHSDQHLLYCPWDDRAKTLVTREEFVADLHRNLDELGAHGVERTRIKWWIPPYEWYNEEIAQWAREAGYPLFSFSPGTVSHADYTEDDAANFRSNEVILQNVLAFEEEQPDGLNGFLLLTHVSASPKRTRKFSNDLHLLIDALAARGYEFVPLERMLEGALEEKDWGS